MEDWDSPPDDLIAAALAAHRLYDAFVLGGFTTDQALTLVGTLLAGQTQRGAIP